MRTSATRGRTQLDTELELNTTSKTVRDYLNIAATGFHNLLEVSKPSLVWCFIAQSSVHVMERVYRIACF